jgi:hypothetical protein
MDSLPPDTAVGLLFYPDQVIAANPTFSRYPTSCISLRNGVAMLRLGASGSMQRTEIAQSLAAIGIPETGAGTPTDDAYLLTVISLASLAAEPNQEFILLVTDGVPTVQQGCIGSGGEETPIGAAGILAQIAAARAEGVRTFVVGVPSAEATLLDGTDSRAWLSQAARAGGTAVSPDCSDQGPNFCHFDLSTQVDLSQPLTAALKSLAPRTRIGCTRQVSQLDLDGVSIDTAQTTLVYWENTETTNTPHLIVRNDQPDCQYGWHYADGAQTTIEICGALCERIQNAPDARLDVNIVCKYADGGIH